MPHDEPIRAGERHGRRERDGLIFFCMNFRITLHVLLIALLAVGPTGCSHDARPNPKDTIKNMFEAMRTSDSVALAVNIDLASAARDMQDELWGTLPDSVLALSDPADRLLASMVGEGELRKRWLSDNQIVIGKSEIAADTALVEVSFLDRVTRVQYYNKMRLVFRQGRWIVTDFKTL